MAHNKIEIPKNISPSPILEAIVEVRFESSIPGDAIFGLLYSNLKSRYPTLERLPILQLPEAVRTMDKGLRYQPHYKLHNDNYTINIGPKVISVIQNVPKDGEYPGWDQFKAEIEFTLKKVKDLGLIDRVVRLGIRYINFFDDDAVFSRVNLSVSTPFAGASERVLSTAVDKAPFSALLQISNTAQAAKSGSVRQGSIIDVDVYMENVGTFNVRTLLSKINHGHVFATELFFGSITQEYLDTLNPTY